LQKAFFYCSASVPARVLYSLFGDARTINAKLRCSQRSSLRTCKKEGLKSSLRTCKKEGLKSSLRTCKKDLSPHYEPVRKKDLSPHYEPVRKKDLSPHYEPVRKKDLSPHYEPIFRRERVKIRDIARNRAVVLALINAALLSHKLV